MPDLGLKSFDKLYPMMIRKYQDLIVDQNASEADKINSIILKLNALGKLSNDVVRDWNTVYNWAMNDGLTQDVSNKLEAMRANGEFDNLVSAVVALVGDVTTLTTTAKDNTVNAINEVNALAKGNQTKLGDLTSLHTTAKDTTVNAINEVDDLAKSNQTKLGDLTTLQTADKDTIVHAINDNVVSLGLKTPKSKTDVWKDVKTDFGAKGDGVTDDTTAIQSAFNNGNVNLYFPAGTYLISNYIQVYKNTTVQLHPNAIVKRIGSYNKMFVNGQYGNSTYVPGGVYTGEGNIHFIGGTFDMNCQVGSTSPLPATTTTSFFDMLHAENISFDSITVKNAQIGHYFQVSSCKNVRFTNCWFGATNYTGTGGSDYDYECIQVEVATSSSNQDFGIYDLTISRDVVVENCTFDGCIRAFGNHGDAKYGTANVIFCENIKFVNNKIFNSIDNSINMTGLRYVSFKDNLIVNAGAYGISLVSVEDSSFTSNLVLTSQKSNLVMTTVNNCKFRDNIFKDSAQTGVYGAIRLTTCLGNSFDNDTVSASTVKYTYSWYSSNGSTGNSIKSPKFTAGTSGNVRDADGNHIERVTGIQLGTTAPTTTPDFRGQEFLDTTNNKVYKAINTTASTDWLLLN